MIKQLMEALEERAEERAALPEPDDGLDESTRRARAWCDKMGIPYGNQTPAKPNVIPEGFTPQESWTLRTIKEELAERIAADENRARMAAQEQHGADPSRRPRWQAQPQQSSWVRLRRRGYFWGLD
jgi:hypothetical protein